MLRNRREDERIVSAMMQFERGAKATDICGQFGISLETFYLWKQRYFGETVPTLREHKKMLETSGKLERIATELETNRQILREIVLKRL